MSDGAYTCEWCEKQYVVPALARACEDGHLRMAEMVQEAEEVELGPLEPEPGPEPSSVLPPQTAPEHRACVAESLRQVAGAVRAVAGMPFDEDGRRLFALTLERIAQREME